MNSINEKIKLDQIKICTLFECKWNTVSSSVLGMMAVAKCGLRRIFEKRERVAESYVMRIGS